MSNQSRTAPTTCPTLRRLEPLEGRTLFNTLVFDGTAGDDTIVLVVQKETIAIDLNGSVSFFSDDSYDAIDLRGLDGDDAIFVNESGDNDIFVRGDHADGSGAGNDTIDIGTGNLDAVGSPVVVTAGGGTDLLRLNDQNNNFSDPFTVTSTTAGRIFFGGLTYGTDLESLIVNNSSRNNVVTVSSTSPATIVSINGGLGTDTIHVNETDPASPVVILPSPGDDLVNVNLDGLGSAGARFELTQRVFRLNVGAGGSAQIAPQGGIVLSMVELLIDPAARFDITNNAAVIDYAAASPIAQVEVYLANGYNNGGWNGAGGIVSSTAAGTSNTGVGYAEATDLFTSFPAMFAGVAVDATSVLLRHTFYGDADLNRTVNLADFNRLASHFGQAERRWSHGDFDYNGTVNLNDFNRLAANFGAQAGPAGDADADESF